MPSLLNLKQVVHIATLQMPLQRSEGKICGYFRVPTIILWHTPAIYKVPSIWGANGPHLVQPRCAVHWQPDSNSVHNIHRISEFRKKKVKK
jgi:hypothetical protein